MRLRSTTEHSTADSTQPDRALRQQAATMRALTEGTTDAVWAKGCDGVYHLINSARARMLGISASEILGRTDEILFSAESAAEIRARDCDVFETGVASAHTAVLVDVHGVTRSFTTTRSPWTDDDGNIMGLVGVSRDVTDQLRAEAALRAGEQRYRLLVENSPEAIIVHRDGILLYINRTCALLLGAEPTAIVGRSILDFVHHDSVERVTRAISARSTGEFETRPTEYRIVTLDGAPADVEALSVLIEHDGLPAVQTVMRNVTARRAAESALLDREARLRLVMQQIPAILWATDRDARFTSGLDAGLTAMGLRPNELVGVLIQDYFGSGEHGGAPVRATRMALHGQGD